MTDAEVEKAWGVVSQDVGCVAWDRGDIGTGETVEKLSADHLAARALNASARCAWCGTVTARTPHAMLGHQMGCEARKDAQEAQLRATEEQLRQFDAWARILCADVLDVLKHDENRPEEGLNEKHRSRLVEDLAKAREMGIGQ